MKKKFKKLFTSLLALAMVLSSFTIPTANVQAAEETATTAYLSFMDAEGTVQYWMDGNDYAPVVATNADVTGFGQYTVALDFTGVDGGVAPDMAFFDVEISDGEALYPNSFMNIDSVKINGKEVDLGKTYTSSDDGIATRSNLFNTWVSEVTGGRTADGDSADVSATPVGTDVITNISSLEVTFTLSEGVAFGDAITDGVAKAAIPLPAEGTTAYLSMADTGWTAQYWFDGNDYAPVVATNATVTGFGQYTVALDFTGVDGGVCPDLGFLDVEVDNGELYFPNSYLNIDSVKINGEEVEVGNTYTSSDNAEDTRSNLYNTWVSEVTEGRSGELDLSECTATPIAGENYTDIQTVEVTFTIVEGEAVEASEAEYVIPTEFNAFLMFSDESTVWENYEPGTPGDATILGDGTYTVFLKASDIGATAQATKGAVFLVDIEGLGDAMKAVGTLREDADGAFVDTDATASVQVFVDGVEVTSKSDNILLGDLEGNGRLRLELYNMYGSGTADKPVVMPEVLTPADEIKVVFTLTGTGLNTGAAVEEVAAEEETTAVEVVEESNSGLSTGVIVGIVIAVVVVAGVVCVVVLKKKKAIK